MIDALLIELIMKPSLALPILQGPTQMLRQWKEEETKSLTPFLKLTCHPTKQNQMRNLI
jgi:hypothetical protein